MSGYILSHLGSVEAFLHCVHSVDSPQSSFHNIFLRSHLKVRRSVSSLVNLSVEWPIMIVNEFMYSNIHESIYCARRRLRMHYCLC